MAKATAVTEQTQDAGEIEIPAIDIGLATIIVEGITPLIMHRWSEKAKQMMRDKHQKRATAGRAVRVPEDEAREATYFISADRYGFPATAFKSAMVDAAVTLNQKKTVVRRAFHVEADAQTPDGDMVEIISPDGPLLREDMVRVGMGSADLRYRPQFTKWGARLRIRFDKAQISIAQLTNLVNKAGFSTGIGEWRIEKDGEYGQFQVAGIEA